MYNVVSLFCGCGGVDLGTLGGFTFNKKEYAKHPCKLVYACDIDQKAIDSHKLNFGSEKAECADVAPKTVTSTSSTPEKAAALNAKGDKKSVTAPLPGVIVALKVQVGEQVKAGQTIAVLEAMKMENDIQSEYDGVVLSVDVNPGDSVLEGATIVTIG